MICDECGFDSPSYSIRVTPRGPRRVCRHCKSPRSRESVVNPYDLTLDHVHDHSGQPLRVTSLRQLQAAEKEFRFRSLVANENENRFDEPPQHKQPDLFEATTEAGNWLYPEVATQMVRELRDCGEI
jgi:hypothetical protein